MSSNIKRIGSGFQQEQNVECGLDCMLRTFKWRRPRPDIRRKLEDDFHRSNSIFYAPIKPWQIRLLQLRRGRPGEALQLDLHTATLVHEGAVIESTEECVPFAALSYSWGYSGHTTTVKVGESRLRVLSVVQEALEPLQQILSVKSLEYVWIDGLCINQFDVVERSEQVRRMARIYSMARLVVIWPGNFEQCGGDAVNYIRQYDSRVTHTEECKRGLEDVAQGLLQLLGRPWFERTWARQEIFAAAKAELLVGTMLIPFWEFKRSLRLIVDQINTQLSASSTEHMQRLLRYLDHLSLLTQPSVEDTVQLRSAPSRGHLLGVDKWRLDTYLRGSDQFKATDPRDFVYGIISMTSVKISDKVSRYPGLPPSLPLSYKKTIREVFADTTIYLINCHQSLDVMYLGYSGGRDIENQDLSMSLPSWVPDWTSLPLITYLDYVWFVFRRVGSRTFMSTPFSIDLLKKETLDWMQLNLSKRFRRPEKLDPMGLAWDMGDIAGDSRTAPGLTNGAAERNSRPFIQIEGVPFARVGHKVLKGEKVTWSMSKTDKSYRQYMQDWSVKANMKFVEPETDKKSEIFATWQPTPFRKSGCWVPAASLPEDVIVFLPRATLPAVLRKRADILGLAGRDITEFYELIGPCVSFDYIFEEAPMLDDQLRPSGWLPNPWRRDSSSAANTFRKGMMLQPTQEFAIF